MNDFDNLLNDAFAERGNAAPIHRPTVAEIVERHQSRLRRRTVVASGAMIVLGLTGMAAIAVDSDDATDVADAPDSIVDSGVERPSTNLDVGEVIWFCEGAVDRWSIAPTTTITLPATLPATVVATNGAATLPEPPLEDSGYFRHCNQLVVGSDDVPASTLVDTFPTTTVFRAGSTSVSSDDIASAEQTYIIQAGDFPIGIADLFCVDVDAMLNYNNWDDAAQWPFPGETVLIPPGGCIGPDGPPAQTPPSTEHRPATTTTSPSPD